MPPRALRFGPVMPALLARLFGPEPDRRFRRLAGVVAVGTGAAAAVHALDPGLPFPLLDAWFAAAALVAAGLALAPLGVTGRRVGALVVVALLLYGGLPAAHNATFPWIELGRARIPEWEDLAIFGTCAAISVTAIGAGRAERLAGRGIALVAAAVLAVTLLLPAKSSFQVLSAPQPGMVTLPVLAWDAPVQMRWTRVNTTGNALLYLPALARDEWALLEIAGGIHQEAGRTALAKGEGSEAITRLREVVRYGLVRGLEGVVLLTLLLRAAGVPAAAIVLASLLAPRPIPDGLRRASAGVLRGSLWLVPVANLVALAVATLAWLPDDLALRVPALLSGLGTLAIFGLVEATVAPAAVSAAAREAA